MTDITEPLFMRSNLVEARIVGVGQREASLHVKEGDYQLCYLDFFI